MAKNKEIEIIFENENILVVNKPANVSVTKDRSGKEQLTDILAKQIGQKATDKLLLVHRLDKQTSGVLILAKNTETQSALSSCFEKQLVKKTYLAIVSGLAHSDHGQINAQITGSTKEPGKMCITRKHGKKAKTNWKVLANFELLTLLAVSPVTGRTHQIRVHLPTISLPLAVDPLYGSDRGIFLSDIKKDYKLGKYQTEEPLMDRLTLHAYQITLPIPPSDIPQTFIAPLDKNFKTTIKMLTRHNPKGLEAFTDKQDFERIINTQPLSSF